MRFIPQDLTRHPDATTREIVMLWLSDIMAGAGFILFCIAVFVVAAVWTNTTDDAKPIQHSTEKTIEL